MWLLRVSVPRCKSRANGATATHNDAIAWRGYNYWVSALEPPHGEGRNKVTTITAGNRACREITIGDRGVLPSKLQTAHVFDEGNSLSRRLARLAGVVPVSVVPWFLEGPQQERFTVLCLQKLRRNRRNCRLRLGFGRPRAGGRGMAAGHDNNSVAARSFPGARSGLEKNRPRRTGRNWPVPMARRRGVEPGVWDAVNGVAWIRMGLLESYVTSAECSDRRLEFREVESPACGRRPPAAP